MKLLVNCPINSLGFGNVGFNLLREMWKRQYDVSLFPSGNKVDVNPFEINEDFKKWLEDAINNRYKKLESSRPSIKLWHINGAETRLTPYQVLYTFHELDQPTEQELAILRLQNHACFGCSYSKQIFDLAGLDESQTSVAPVGFDEDFGIIENRENPVIHFSLMGKMEKRKHTLKILKTWIKKYGNNINYQLSCCINNPFIKPEKMKEILFNALEGKTYFNVNFLPFLEKNAQMNAFINKIDIDLTGLSGAEGWNMPAFNATALGKWSIVLNATAHKDWANKDNSILVQPSGKEEAYDGMFFSKGQHFNQGNIYQYDEEKVLEAFEIAEKKAKTVNVEGIKLQKKFKYSDTLDTIIKNIK